jgi:hypothetical protein
MMPTWTYSSLESEEPIADGKQQNAAARRRRRYTERERERERESLSSLGYSLTTSAFSTSLSLSLSLCFIRKPHVESRNLDFTLFLISSLGLVASIDEDMQEVSSAALVGSKFMCDTYYVRGHVVMSGKPFSFLLSFRFILCCCLLACPNPSTFINGCGWEG